MTSYNYCYNKQICQLLSELGFFVSKNYSGVQLPNYTQPLDLGTAIRSSIKIAEHIKLTQIQMTGTGQDLIQIKIDQIANIVNSKKIKTINGKYKSIKADTICIHSDTDNSIEILKEINKVLKNKK